MENQWTSGLFNCMADNKTACLTIFCPCVTFGRIANIADEGKNGYEKCGIFYGLICCVVALPCLFSCTYRTKIRIKFGLPESPASDCLTHCFCECCALCQEYRELQNRGLDPSIGWNGNMQQTMAPPLMSQHAPPPTSQHAPPMSQHMTATPPPTSQHAPPTSQHAPPSTSQHDPPPTSQQTPPMSQHMTVAPPPVSQHVPPMNQRMNG